MYYCLRCPPLSLIIFARHSLLFHQFSSPLLSVCHISWVELACILSVWCGTANRLKVCAYSRLHQSSSGQCPDAGGLPTSIFQSVDLFVQTLYFLLLSRDSVN